MSKTAEKSERLLSFLIFASTEFYKQYPSPLDLPAPEDFQLIYRKARRGDSQAQYHLGGLYYEGEVVPRDFQKALEWYTKAAEQGFGPALLNLGVMYDKGKGVSQDYEKAVEWYRKAAEQGIVLAQYNLGNMFREGLGVPRDSQKALEYYTQAAQQGFALAQFNLGLMYIKEQGVERNETEALAWIYVAQIGMGKVSMEGINQAIEVLEEQLSETVVFQAQQRAQELHQQIQKP